jgi:DNA-3-methyladenine glycosylase II
MKVIRNRWNWISMSPYEEKATLSVVPPFRLDFTVWALRRRKENSFDSWSDGVYQRVLVIKGKPVLIRTRQIESKGEPKIEVILKRNTPDVRTEAARIIEWMLDIKTNLGDFYRIALTDDKLGPLAKRFIGLKPPRFPSLFEALVNGICCQQLSLTVGIILLSRLSETYGLSIPDAKMNSFPEPQSLAKATVQKLRELGLSRQKAVAIIELSENFARQPLEFRDLEGLDNESVVARLVPYRGVGRWTAEYALLRGLGRLNTFPGDDVGARNNLKRWFGIEKPLSYHDVNTIMAKWHPFEGLIYIHFLLNNLYEHGFVTEEMGA